MGTRTTDPAFRSTAAERIAATLAGAEQAQDLLGAAGIDQRHYELYVIGNADGGGHKLGLMFQSGSIDDRARIAEQATGILRAAGWRTEPVTNAADSFAVALYAPESRDAGSTTLAD